MIPFHNDGSDSSMRASDEKSVPEEWRDKGMNSRVLASAVGIALIGLLFAVMAIFTWRIGMVVGAVFTAVISCFFFSTVCFAYVHSLRRPKGWSDITSEGGALVIVYSRPVFSVLVVIVGVVVLLTGGVAVAVLISAGAGTGSGGAIIPGLFGVYMASFLVDVATSRVRRGSLTLSPDGIRQRGWSYESYLSWDAVIGGKAAYYDHRKVLIFAYSNAEWERRHTTRLWRIDRLPPVPMMELDCRNFDIDPVVLFHLVMFYVDNPLARAELSSDAPLRRLQQSSW